MNEGYDNGYEVGFDDGKNHREKSIFVYNSNYSKAVVDGYNDGYEEACYYNRKDFIQDPEICYEV